MKKYFIAFFTLVFLGCDDGDFFTDNLDFENSAVSLCGSYVFNKISSSRTESLVVYLNTNQNILETLQGEPLIFNINNSSNRVVYRIFDGTVSSSYFCNEIPPTTPVVIEEWTAPSGVVQLSTVLDEDDQDGLDPDAEGINYDDLSQSLDTDGDGIPDYKDVDDDGDNVLTKDEDLNKNGNYEDDDTDGDGIPNYLDPDDDGDGILTRDEDTDGDLNPHNDLVPGSNLRKYLDPLSVEKVTATAYRPHTIAYRYRNEIRLLGGFVLENGKQEIKFQSDDYLYGTYNGSFRSREETPPFN